jgi:hypothetical protein
MSTCNEATDCVLTIYVLTRVSAHGATAERPIGSQTEGVFEPFRVLGSLWITLPLLLAVALSGWAVVDPRISESIELEFHFVESLFSFLTKNKKNKKRLRG